MSMNIDYLQNPKHVYAPVHGGMESTAAVLALALTRKFRGNDPKALRATAKRLAGVAAPEVRATMNKLYRVKPDAAVLDAVELMVERTRLLLNEGAAKGWL